MESKPAVAQPLSTLLASHRQALASVAALCEGQTALLRATDLACRMGGGEARRETYLRQMGLLCMQQKLLASQLVDAIEAEKRAVSTV